MILLEQPLKNTKSPITTPNIESTPRGSDYWPLASIPSDIAVKEALALANFLQSRSHLIANSWVDVYVDSKAWIGAWNKQVYRASPLFQALKFIFAEAVSFNFSLQFHYISSSDNQLRKRAIYKTLYGIYQIFQNGRQARSQPVLSGKPRTISRDHFVCLVPSFSEMKEIG